MKNCLRTYILVSIQKHVFGHFNPSYSTYIIARWNLTIVGNDPWRGVSRGLFCLTPLSPSCRSPPNTCSGALYTSRTLEAGRVMREDGGRKAFHFRMGWYGRERGALGQASSGLGWTLGAFDLRWAVRGRAEQICLEGRERAWRQWESWHGV